MLCIRDAAAGDRPIHRAQNAETFTHSTPFASRPFGNHHCSEERMKNLLVRFISEDQGQDLIEYGLLVGIITTVGVVAITSIGGKVKVYFDNLDGVLP